MTSYTLVHLVPVSMALDNHYYYRSKEAAELKAKLWYKSDPTDIFRYGGGKFFNQGLGLAVRLRLGLGLRLGLRSAFRLDSGLDLGLG